MIKICYPKTMAILISALGALVGHAEQSALRVTVIPDRTNAIYECGSTVTFTISASKNGDLIKNGTVTVLFSNDGLTQLKKQSFSLENGNPFKASILYNEPGIVQCQAIFEKKTFIGGAAFEPKKIEPVAKMPKDFDIFWEKVLQMAKKVPDDVKLFPDDRFKSSYFNMYRLSLNNIDNTRIYGFLSVPKNRKGPFPAIVLVPGAGASLSEPFFGLTDNKEFYQKLASNGVLILVLNVHDYEPPANVEEYQKTFQQMQQKLNGYQFIGAPDKDKYFYKKVIAGINRAVDYVASRPDWNGQHFVAYGFSQGGGMALALGALNKNITAIAALNPALCDHEGFRAGRMPGWPKLYQQAGPEMDKYMEMSRYFDGVNFARKLKCPALFTAGLIDTTCSPSSVYAAYNSVNSSKQIISVPDMPHTYTPSLYKHVSEWIATHLK